MELSNDFRVSVPPADAWKLLTDLERIAPMLPGAQLQEVEGDEYRGIVKVKVGPITAQYKGTATFQDQDEAAGRVVLKAAGRDTRGQGNASAVITATMTPDGEGTKVNVSTDLTITGKVAQFGRGVLADVSAKLMGQFADSLETDLQRGSGADSGSGPSGAAASAGGAGSAGGAASGGVAGHTASAADPGDAVPDPGPSGAGALGADPAGPVAEAAEIPGAGASNGAAGTSAAGSNGAASAPGPAPTAARSGPRRIDSPDPEPVDLLDAAGGSVAKRLVPLLGGLALVLLLLAVRRARRR